MPTTDDLAKDLAALDKRVDTLETQADRARTVESYIQLRFDTVDQQISHVHTRISKLERTIDARFDKITTDINEIKATLAEMPRTIIEALRKP
jgi:chaperonin cofactor prefoldin